MSTISTFCHLAYIDFAKKLTVIEQKDYGLLEKSDESLLVCSQYYDLIRNEVIARGFSSEQEEINFFKFIKPKFSSEFCFHLQLYLFRKDCPEGDEQVIKTYVRKAQRDLLAYIQGRQRFDEYLKLGLDYMDQVYFVRGEFNYKIYADVWMADYDPLFTTMIDPVVGNLIACKRMYDYLAKVADTGNLAFKTPTPWMLGTEEDIKWTGKAAELFMLVYALCETGVLNNGTANIKKVTRQFEEMFKIQLGDPYDTFYHIKMRKTGAVKFIEKLQAAVEKKLEGL